MVIVRDVVVSALERLLPALKITDRGPFWPLFELLTRESLTITFGGRAPRFSGICADGMPWQFCIPLGETATAEVRYLTEVGAPGTSLTSRLRLSRDRLGEVIALLRLPPATTGYVDSLFAMLPSADDALDTLTGGVWVGVAVRHSGEASVRIYANCEWGDDLARWQRVTDALRRMHAGGFARLLRTSVGELAGSFLPAGLAVSLHEPPGLKLYLRPKVDPWEACRRLARRPDFGLPEALLDDVQRALGLRLEESSPRSLILSLGGLPDGGAPELKFDLNVMHLLPDESRRERAVETLAAALGIPAVRYHLSMAAIRAAAPSGYAPVHDFLGVGGGPRGLRLNVYVRSRRGES